MFWKYKKNTYFFIWTVSNTFSKKLLSLPKNRLTPYRHIWIFELEFWSDVWPSMVTHTRNLCSAFNPSKCTHTHCEHTPGAVGSQCCGTQGAVGGSVPCSRVSPQSWYWRWREHWTFTPPTDNSWTWDSNPQPQVTSPTLYPLGHDCPTHDCPIYHRLRDRPIWMVLGTFEVFLNCSALYYKPTSCSLLMYRISSWFLLAWWVSQWVSIFSLLGGLD